MPFQKNKQKYTHEDYLSWPEDERIEIIRGTAYHTYGGEITEGMPVTQATPRRIHQAVFRALFTILANFLEGKPCEVYGAPFAVRLNTDDDTTVEPDILVVCDPSKLDDKGCNGAPDLIIEVLSPSTAQKDRVVKYELYKDAGVREFWLVDPDTESVHVNLMENGRYYGNAYLKNAAVPVTVLPGCVIELEKVFPDAESKAE